MKNLINKNIIYYSITLLLIIVFGFIRFVLPETDKMDKFNKKIKENEAQIMLSQNQINAASSRTKTTPKIIESVPVVIYNSPYPGLDIETAAVELVDQFIEMIRSTQNRIVEISFNAKPAEPTSPASTLSLNISLNSSYASFQSLLQKIYQWKYLASIKDINIDPEQGDPNNLAVRLTLDLYINK